MTDLEKFIRNVKSLDAKKLIVEAAGMSTDKLADLNRQNLTEGKLSSGDDTEEYASIYYTNKKAQMGSISVPNMDFKFTGAFHNSIFAKESGNEIEFGATDEKTARILKNWGNDVLGVHDKQLENVADENLPGIMDKQMMKI